MNMTTPTNEEVRRQFEAWYPGSGVDGCTVEKVAARFGYVAGYQAALSSPAVVALVEAVEAALNHSNHVCVTEHGGKRSPEAAAHYNRLRAALAPLRKQAARVDEGVRDRVAKAIADVIGHGMREKCYSHADAALEAALSAQPAERQGEESLYVEARQCEDCDHLGINDCSDTHSACGDCEWQGPTPDEDKCPGCGHENCMAVACPECGGRYRFLADRRLTYPTGAVDATWRIDTDDEVEKVAKAAGWDNRRYMTPADYAIWCNRMREFVRQAIVRPAHGYVLVPREPTQAMTELGAVWGSEWDACQSVQDIYNLFRSQWARALAAAPSAPQGVE